MMRILDFELASLLGSRMINRRVDDEVGLIYVTADGEWSEAEVDQHYDKLREIIADFRRNGRRVRVLSDVSQAKRQSPGVEARALEQIERTFLRGDRIAILTANEADRGHVRSLIGDTEIALFCSSLAAEMWLLHDRLDVPASDRRR